MVPRDQFYRMAALALIALILLVVVSVRAFAMEAPEEYLDSGVPLAAGETLAADIAAIRQSLDVLLYFVAPFSFALFVCWKLGQWFYCTFIESVL